MTMEFRAPDSGEQRTTMSSELKSFDPDRRVETQQDSNHVAVSYNPDSRVIQSEIAGDNRVTVDSPVNNESVIDCTNDGRHETGVYEYLICQNEALEGHRHPITGVPFVRRIVTLESGRVVEGVFPRFESYFDGKLPKELYQASNATQFKECNKQLLKALKENPELRSKFTDEFIEQVTDGCKTGAAPDFTGMP